jgi:hypothetical protein
MMRTLTFVIVVALATAGHAQTIDESTVRGTHDVTALIGGWARDPAKQPCTPPGKPRVAGHRAGARAEKDPLDELCSETEFQPAAFGEVPGITDDTLGLSSFAPTYNPSDWMEPGLATLGMPQPPTSQDEAWARVVRERRGDPGRH